MTKSCSYDEKRLWLINNNNNNTVRILFMGTPEYARIIGQGLSEQSGVVMRVVSQPDACAGRKLLPIPSPVSQWAQEKGLPLDRPIRMVDFRDTWRQFAPDLIVTAAYGRILRPWLLSLPTIAAVNLHASLLPRWRGPNPIAWAIRSGDSVTGVTLMTMDDGIDSGPILSQVSIPIGRSATLGDLTQSLAIAGRDLLIANLSDLVANRLTPVMQSSEGVTYAPKFSPEEAHITWQQSDEQLVNLVRSMTPSPVAYTMFRAQRLQILKVKPEATVGLAPGQLRIDKEGAIVGTGGGAIRLLLVKPSGKRLMTGAEWGRGIRLNGEEFLT